MAMGFAGAFADVMFWDDIKKLCHKQCSQIETVLRENGMDLDDYIRFLAREDHDALPKRSLAGEMVWLFDKLQEAFIRATEVGKSSLELCPRHHSEDEVDRYDQIRGGFFHVEGVYQYSRAGEKFKNKIGRRYYVEHG